jgi:hypothetical protein
VSHSKTGTAVQTNTGLVWIANKICSFVINKLMVQFCKEKLFSSLLHNVTSSTYPCIKTTGPSSGTDISASSSSPLSPQEEGDSLLPSFLGLDGGVKYSSSSRR